MRRPQLTLEVLSLFFNKQSKEIEQMSQPFLSRLRIYYPDEVDSFLEEQHASEEFRLQVQTNEPAETVGQLIGQRAAFFILDNIILLGSPVLRTRLIHVLAKATEYKNAQEWLDYMLREIINLVYGAEVLRQVK